MSQQVIDRIIAIGRRRRAPRTHVKAALETGRIESNFENLPGGDADSQGWRQERASLYPNPRNLNASINRFFDEAAKLDRGQKSYELAADVQRPAEQYRGRYKTASREAQRLSAGGPRSQSNVRPSGATAAPAGTDRRAALRQYLRDEGKPDSLLNLASDLKASKAPSAPAPSKRKDSSRRRAVAATYPKGAARRFEVIAGDLGLPITAREEPGHAVGGDHDPAVRGATAIDVGGDEDRRKQMFHKVTRRLGVKGAVYKGEDINVTVNGLRYQIISRDHGSGPHLHIGIRRVNG